MRNLFYIICFMVFPLLLWSQQEYHVFPIDHQLTPGKEDGNGTLKQPWDLQTALSQSSDKVKGGDIIWLHEGIYNGRFISSIAGQKNKPIVVAAYELDKVILNGNVSSKRGVVLEVKGGYVVFKNFEITFLGTFSRDKKDENFQVVGGINHVDGEDCVFRNLKIHNTPGSGIGSWKRTGGSIIEGCRIFNNGYFSAKRGSGVGIYVQNESDKIRLIKNNIIFSNYYKGIEVWSDNLDANHGYVKNVTIDNNVFFNSGLPSGKFRDNLIIGTNDNNGVNVAKDIKVINNIFYHNTNLTNEIENSQAPSLTLGFNKKAPVKEIVVSNNLIIGRKDALLVLYVKSLTFTSNIVYSGYVRFNKAILKQINVNDWKFRDNTYYTRRSQPIRIEGFRDYNMPQWQKTYGIDTNSQWKKFTEFNIESTLSISKIEHKDNVYRVTVFNKEGKDVIIDFSGHQIKLGSTYVIKNIETDEVISSGIFKKSKTVTAPMGTYNGTFPNFGVYYVDFSLGNSE